MQVCTRCLYTSRHPFGLTFDEEGVCSGCRVHEEKDQIDWGSRGERLRALLDQFRNKSGYNYDCIVPVSGARDSFFIVHMLKRVYGMNPLLVTYNKHYNTDAGVRNLANLRTQFDCDIMTMTVNPEAVKRITRSTLRIMGSLYWHCIAGQTVFPVQAATKFKIPLIVWGSHQGIDQVGMFSRLDEVEMTRKYRKEHDLMGYEAEDLVNEFDSVTEADIRLFMYPDDREIERVGVRGIYLENFIRWDSRAQHEMMIERYGYETALQTRTFDWYNDVDCWNYSDLHDYIKLLKLGYGKVTDHACREIRLGRLTREAAKQLVRRYETVEPRNVEAFLKWMGMSRASLDFVLDQHRDASIWARGDNWEWSRIDQSSCAEITLASSSTGPVDGHREFVLTTRGSSSDPGNQYILIGKGVPQS